MYNEMTNKELKEMMNYFAAVEANHRNAGRMESAYEANEKKRQLQTRTCTQSHQMKNFFTGRRCGSDSERAYRCKTE